MEKLLLLPILIVIALVVIILFGCFTIYCLINFLHGFGNSPKIIPRTWGIGFFENMVEPKEADLTSRIGLLLITIFSFLIGVFILIIIFSYIFGHGPPDIRN